MKVMARGFIFQSIFLLKDIMASWSSEKKKTPRKVTKQEYISNTFSSLNMILKHQSCHPPAVAKVKCSPQMPEHSFYLINFLTGETSQLLKKKIIDPYGKRKRMI